MDHIMQRCFNRFLVCLSLLAEVGACAQVNDAFSDGNFNIGTVWTGNDALFAVVDDGGNQRLRSASPGAANYYLSTPSTIVDDAYWELFFDLRFATSGANYVDMYLMSGAADLSSGVNGYFLRIGGTNDRLELFRSPAIGEVSRAGESEAEFRARLAQAARERRDALTETLRRKFAPKMTTLSPG